MKLHIRDVNTSLLKAVLKTYSRIKTITLVFIGETDHNRFDSHLLRVLSRDSVSECRVLSSIPFERLSNRGLVNRSIIVSSRHHNLIGLEVKTHILTEALFFDNEGDASVDLILSMSALGSQPALKFKKSSGDERHAPVRNISLEELEATVEYMPLKPHFDLKIEINESVIEKILMFLKRSSLNKFKTIEIKGECISETHSKLEIHSEGIQSSLFICFNSLPTKISGDSTQSSCRFSLSIFDKLCSPLKCREEGVCSLFLRSLDDCDIELEINGVVVCSRSAGSI
ncbi:hypothetical protein GEMRC1_004915 [Eukaryota sp. GEM-RC1]